jgi:hypothetical protein
MNIGLNEDFHGNVFWGKQFRIHNLRTFAENSSMNMDNVTILFYFIFLELLFCFGRCGDFRLEKFGMPREASQSEPFEKIRKSRKSENSKIQKSENSKIQKTRKFKNSENQKIQKFRIQKSQKFRNLKIKKIRKSENLKIQKI